LLPKIGIHLGTGIVSAIINAVTGAICFCSWFGFCEDAAVWGRPGQTPMVVAARGKK
jgi:hypothetical protein